MSRRLNRRATGHAVVVRAAASSAPGVESLEPRWLLSAVTTFAIPGASADNFNWYGSSHMVAGPDGNLWFTDPGNNQIDRVTPAGVITQFNLPVHNVPVDGSGSSSSGSSGNSGGGGIVSPPLEQPDDPTPDDIIVGPNGNLWFTESGVDRIGEITTSGVITEFTTPTADSEPTGLAVGSDGNIWFTESGTNDIGRITPSGTIKEFTTADLDLSSTDKMVLGSNGSLWFIAYDNDGDSEAAEVDTAGKVTAFQISSSPNDLTVGPDGNIWLASSGEIDQVTPNGTLTAFTIPTGDDASAITVGPDGAFWFALDGTNQLGRMTTGGVFSEFALPEPGATDGSTISIDALATGPDGNLWFADYNVAQVGFVSLSGALLAGGDAVTVTAGTTSTATLATFDDYSGGAASDYTATIIWDDGANSAGTITSDPNGGFDVSATRDWTLNDSDATVTITDTRDAARTATADASITANPPAATGTGVTLTTTSAEAFTGAVASFTGIALNSLDSYSATINWGDGHVSNGTIAENASGGIDVSGSNTYAASGTYAVTTNLSPYPGGFLYPGGGIWGIAPVPLGGPVAATATSTGVNKPVSHKPVAVPLAGTAATSVKAAASSNAISISPIVGPILPILPVPPISEPGFASATSTMTVAEGEMNGTGYTVQASTTAAFSGVVASFSLANPAQDLSTLQATVIWSDPSVQDWFSVSNPPTAGTITSDGNGGFTVSVNTTFANPGWSHFVVNITDSSASDPTAVVGVAYGELVVGSPHIWLPVLEEGGVDAPTGAQANAVSGKATTHAAAATASNVNPDFSEQVTATTDKIHPGAAGNLSGTLGALTGITSNVSRHADLQGTVNWGDGTSSAVTFVAGAKKGTLLVKGSHHYATPGSYTVTASVQQTLYENGKASSLYPMLLPAITQIINYVKPGPITTGGIALSAIAGQSFTATLASFTTAAPAVAVNQTATISWGDGSKPSAGVITSSGTGTLTISVAGTHTYAKGGTFHLHVVVTQSPQTKPPKGTVIPKILANITTRATVTS
jgi:streptogramin lyase